MLWLVFVACILASAFNAASSLAEREATREPHLTELFSRQFSLVIIKNRKFLLGLGFQGLASILIVLALSQGSLVMVGPLLTLDLVFLWIFISLRYKVAATPRNWLAVASIIIGLTLLFVSLQIKPGHPNYDGLFWILASGILGGMIIVAFILTKLKISTYPLVIVLAIVTACNYALDAGLVKLVFGQLQQGGWAGVFGSWPIYALLFFAAVSIVMTQNTYAAGPLTVSQPIIEIAQTVVSMLIGIFIFHDLIKHNKLSLVGLCISSALMLAGITVLASSGKLFNSSRTNYTTRAKA
jgi:hypothetical protein